MGNNITKKQHFVPQFYLNFFGKQKSKEIYSILVSDKQNNKTFKCSTEDIANKHYFYETSNKPDNYWEKEINKLETKMPSVFRTIFYNCHINGNGKKVLNDFLKKELSIFISLQLTRTINAREYFDNICDEITINTINLLKNSCIGVINDKQLCRISKEACNKDFFHDAQLSLFLSNNFLTKASYYLCKRNWIIYKKIGKGLSSIVTSDNPILFYNHVNKNVSFKQNGIDRNETIIYVPLNNELLLVLYPYDFYFGFLEKYDNCVIEIDDEKFFQNIAKLQYENCFRQIYSKPLI